VAGFAASILSTVQMSLATLGAVMTALFYNDNANSMVLLIGLGAVLACAIYLLKNFCLVPSKMDQ
jgi:ABC-type Fe3+-siderophore transport system permease subunit|tara:strand:+ start:1416 stop:1610 length:195 start_codon:yes stop_codon:yes gene_type:complete